MTINIRDFYYHSIIQDYDNTKLVLNSILEGGYIIAPPTKGENKRFGCHSDNQICLSKYTDYNIKKFNIYLSCFDFYLTKFTTILLNKNLDKEYNIFKPLLAPNTELYLSDLLNKGSHTNIYDEFRTIDPISIDYFRGVCIPYDNIINDSALFVIFYSEIFFEQFLTTGLDEYMMKSIKKQNNSKDDYKTRKEFMDNYIKELKEIFGKYNIDIPIYDYKEDKSLILKA